MHQKQTSGKIHKAFLTATSMVVNHYGGEIRSFNGDGLYNDNSRVRRYAVKYLGELGDKRAVQPLLETFMIDDSNRVKIEVVEALGKMGVPDRHVVDLLQEMLQCGGEEMKSIAAEALGNIEDKKALTLLKSVFKQESSPTVKKSILKVIKKIDPDVHDNLIREKERVEELNFINRRE